MKNSIKNSKGYSLVEMIITIAIIGVLAVMAGVSITIIYSARAKDSALKLDAEVSELITRSKNMSSESGDKYGVIVYKDGANYKISRVSVKRDASTKEYKFVRNISGGIDINDADTIVLPTSVTVKFTGKYSSFTGGDILDKDDFAPGDMDSADSVCLFFDKKGNCLSGYGTYSFYKKNGNIVSRVSVRQNGSHEVK